MNIINLKLLLRLLPQEISHTLPKGFMFVKYCFWVFCLKSQPKPFKIWLNSCVQLSLLYIK